MALSMQGFGGGGMSIGELEGGNWKKAEMHHHDAADA